MGPGTEDRGGRGVPAASLHEMPFDLLDDPNDSDGGDSAEDLGDNRDPAAAIFRGDAIRRGYFNEDSPLDVVRRGLAAYYRDFGLMSERAYRRISKFEITGTDIERDADEESERDCGY